ncbi:MAG: hypothetical protein HZB46_01370 [Solirubrobacterales bacterium]|nr:hypothetical protein [Solirubrobacterales bacterium]
MKRILMLAGAVAVIAAPNATADDQPTTTDKANAAQECRTERGTTDASREAFAAKYGTNHNKRNAFGKCVTRKAADEAKESEQARTGAAKACDDERGTTPESQAAFAEKYGTNKNKKNAYGKCVSQKSKELEQAADAEDKAQAMARRSAARQCDDERGETTASRAAFREKYGTGKTKANAFGKCVSKLAKAQQDS